MMRVGSTTQETMTMKVLTREEYKKLLNDDTVVVTKAYLYQKPTHFVSLGKSVPKFPIIVTKKR